jgi:hypothetical protein
METSVATDVLYTYTQGFLLSSRQVWSGSINFVEPGMIYTDPGLN